MSEPAHRPAGAPSAAEGAALQARAKRRVTLAGAALNLPLAIGKIAAGVIGNSQAMIADGVHSLSDLASDLAVLWALGHSAQAPDREHPWGHGRFETLVTLVICGALVLTAAGILVDALLRLLDPAPLAAPTAIALVAAGVSLVVKEGLYQATVRVGRTSGSPMIVANAWHHRTDALSSVVAAVGVAGGMAGWPALDAVAAAVIAVMLIRIAWREGRPAVTELVDSQATEADRGAVQGSLAASAGVRGVRDLRVRRHGAGLVADASLLVDPRISVSEGHRIAEAARADAIAAVPSLGQIVLHVEPEGHAEGYGAQAAPLRDEIEGHIRALVAGAAPGMQVVDLRLDYFDHGVAVAITACLPRAARQDHADLERDLDRRLRQHLPRLSGVSLHLAAEP
jgi:cation diffusion facilitator family transporter